MAKRASAAPKDSPATKSAKARARADEGNGVDSEATRKAFARLQAGHRERLSHMGSAMNECAEEHRLDKAALDEAKKNGVPIRALKSKFKLWVLDTKKEKIISELEPDDRALLDQINTALGGKKGLADSPLGQYAAESGSKTLAGLVDAGAEQTKANVAVLEGGIKQLN